MLEIIGIPIVKPFRIYLSGKINGVSKENTIMSFAKAELDAISVFSEFDSLEIVNPIILSQQLEVENSSRKLSKSDHLLNDLDALYDCDAIFMLRGWESSTEAKIEHSIASYEQSKYLIKYQV